MSDTIVFTFGRMNPPTLGHEAVINQVLNAAATWKADHLIMLSRKVDEKTDPLDFWTRYRYLKMVAPEANIHMTTKDKPTFFHWYEYMYNAGYKNLIIVAGSDRIYDYLELVNKYNNNPACKTFYNFHSIIGVEVDRDDGVSASEMRQCAKLGDYQSFLQLAPYHLARMYIKELYEDVRKGMSLE